MFTITASKTPTVVNVFGQNFTLVETNAPSSYDYNAIAVMGDEPKAKDETRFVLILTESLTMQLQRYLSGLYIGEASDFFGPGEIYEMLMRRLRQ